jgi:hypothetical protein
MSNRLSRLEAQIEGLVEGTLSRLLAGRLQAREVAVRLARAMEDHALPGPGGTRTAPHRYAVHLNPDDAAALQAASPELAKSLIDELVIFARELDLTLAASPAIVIEADPAIELNGIRVEPALAEPKEPTQPMMSMTTPPLPQRAPNKAFLIMDGQRHVPLNRPVITLGRKLDNTVILDDPRISRHHAQLRQRYGRWVLYDLGSAAGTMVNNDRVEECVLRPGDVISLAGVTLIYGEEEQTGKEDTGHTRPMPVRADPTPKMKDELP